MSLAIAEKKPQQQRRLKGGFVGIFFQLLDWNRRLAKKKLFSRKLLPPARAAKVPVKKFAADDKMPLSKLLLIDDENQGGFPSAKKTDVHLGNGMRAPGLVARLMGLDSMPVITHERPRKAIDSGCLRDEESDRELHRIDRDLCVQDGEIGNLETRPQKLHKTGGFLERRPLDGSRAKPGVLGKKVLSSPSKDKHHKLASPVKSPRLASRGHRTRLMKAAAKILEPGLQSRSRAKSAITYVDSSLVDAKGTDVFTNLKNSEESFCDPVPESSMSCGSLGGTLSLDLGEQEPLRLKIALSALEMSNAPCSRTGIMENSSISLGMQGDPSKNRKASVPVQAKSNIQNKARDLAEKKYNQSTHKTKQDGSPTALQRNHFRQNQSTMVRDRVAFGSKVCSRKQGGRDANELNGAKVSVFLDRNVSNYSHVKSANEKNSFRKALGNNSSEKNMARKRTISSFSAENVDALHSSCAKRSVGRESNNQKGIGHTSNRSVYKKCIKSESKTDNSDDFGFRGNNIVSFTFNSPIRHASRSSSCEEVEEKIRSKNEGTSDIGSDKIIVLGAKSNNLTSNRRTTLKGDELSYLLEQKIRELTSMDRDELVARNAQSPSSILQELGTACISKQNDHNNAGGSSKKGVMSCSVDLSDFPTQQTLLDLYKEETKFSPDAVVRAINNNQLSPISILEASFSNESCSFGSLNASSGGKLQFGLVESFNTTPSSEMDTDLLDSATSVDIRRSIIDKIQHLTYISSSNFDIHCDEVGLSKTKLYEARNAISNAVLLFENYTLYGSDGYVDISLESFLLDMLQAIVDALRVGPRSDPSCILVKETEQLKDLLFDCMIECLDSKYSCLCKSASMTYLKLPFLLTRDQLMTEVHEEIRGWLDLAGKFLEDLIKGEMKISTGKWTDSKIEAFEAGMEIESNILQTLVDEMVIDFCRC